MAEVRPEERLDEPDAPDALDLEAGEADLALNPAYYREMKRFSLLEDEALPDLARRIEGGDEEAFTVFFQANLRLVTFVARKLEHRANSLDFDDLVSEGNIGLIRAIQKFNAEEGKFSSYAYKWIYATIMRAINDQDRTIRLPVNIVEKLVTADRIEAELEAASGELPEIEEVAGRVKIEPEKLSELRRARTAPLSLDAPNHGPGEEEGRSLIDIIEDTMWPPDRAVAETEHVTLIRRAIDEALDELDATERLIIRERHGLNAAGEPRYLKQIGKDLGVTGEKVRRVQVEAERKLADIVRKSLRAQGVQIDQTIAIVGA